MPASTSRPPNALVRFDPGPPAGGAGGASPLHAAITRYQADPSPAAADHLLGAARPVLDRAVRVYGGAPTPGLRARAKAITLAVAPRYDAAKGAKPETYLLGHLQSLRRFAARQGAAAHVPDQARLDAPRLDRAARDLAHELGRDPSDAELADHTGLPLGRIARARGLGQLYAESAAPRDAAYAAAGVDAAARGEWLRHVYADLSPPDQLILEHTAGLHGKPVLETGELARRLGVSAGAVSQRKAKLEKMLQEFDRFLEA